MATAGPLPAYGSDLRATAPAPAGPAPVSAAAPVSAPVTPSSASPAVTQSVIANKPAAPMHPTGHSAAGLTESAFAATASGAIAGAAAAQNADRVRLRRLVEAVARQEPRLRWAVGDRDDGTTVVVTDVGSGGIPPDIEIPSGTTLLPPAEGARGLEGLLRDAVVVETWSPGDFLPAAEDSEPVPMSLRPRDLPAVDDLNWQITQATNWRDGLPRLAHTLTKAAVGGTGVLDSETDLLREHLRAISDKVCKSYGGSLDAQSVGTWQLLAAIDALVHGRRTALNYHFAWFQALHTGKRGQ